MKKTFSRLFFLILTLALTNNVYAGLAVAPGVTTDMLDKIDTIQNEPLREMLRTATWPGFGEAYMGLDRTDEDLSQFEQNYKEYPLNWDQKLENVRYILDEADNLQTLTPENLEYIDLEFGEAVIPVPDKRVTAILNTDFLLDEAERLEAERQAALANFYENGGNGETLQSIEDEYAVKLATLMQTENKFKEAKIEYLRLDNKQKFGRIDDETFKTQTRKVVEDFETFVALAGEITIFTEDELKTVANRIYTEEVATPVNTGTSYVAPKEETKWWYWGLSALIMLLALGFGALAFKRYKK